jgi:phytoene dehydrogenase-like protein
MSNRINIIGAGLAGLSTGIFLQREGIETEIFELAPHAGGVCAAWTRRGYRFDGCIHWMVGTRKDDPIYRLYKDVGALTDDTGIYNALSISLEIKGTVYNVPLDLESFEIFLQSLSASDASRIRLFCKDIDMVKRSRLLPSPPRGIKGVLELLRKSRGFLCVARKYRGKTVREVVNTFKSDIIGDILTRVIPGEYSALALFLMLGTRMGGNAGYPLGGASDVVRRMEEKYRSLGGKINFNTKVDEIIVIGGKARGIRVNGTVHQSDGVVAACDAYGTLKKMLRGRYRHPELDEMLVTAQLFNPLAMISFGLDKKFDIPFSAAFEVPGGFETAPGEKRYAYHLRSFDFDASAAPKDGSSVMVMFDVPVDYWLRLKIGNPGAYKMQKERMADCIAAELDARYPGFKDAIAVVDVATPATFVRMTNVYRGSYEGFVPTPAALKRRIRKTIPGLTAFCICGQWTTAGGGICTAIADGKAAARLIKKGIR